MVEQSGEAFLLPSFAACRTPRNPWDTRVPALYGRAYGPRNFMKRSPAGGRMGTAGSGEADDTVDKLRPSLCMVQSVRN